MMMDNVKIGRVYFVRICGMRTPCRVIAAHDSYGRRGTLLTLQNLVTRRTVTRSARGIQSECSEELAMRIVTMRTPI